jgi:hypothetical protein
VKDINGQELIEGGAALLLCEILSIGADGVVLRVMNSELEIAVGAKHDEVLGGLVAESELTAFIEQASAPDDAKQCLCIVGCSTNGACPIHGDGGHLPTRADFEKSIKCRME